MSAIASHFEDIEIKAEAIERVCRRRRWTGISDPFASAAALRLRGLPRSMRTGRCHVIPKANGQLRVVSSLSWPLRVGQGMAKEVIAHAHVPADHIGDWCGRGPNYHIRRVCEALQHGCLVLVADVRNCFSSVQPDAVYRLGLLPSDVVESCLDIRRIRLRAPHGGQRSSIGYTFDRTGRLGLLSGGSASSLLWGMMIDDLPDALPAGVWANTYADNIVIICHSTRDRDEAESALIRYFTDHQAGPFVLTITRADAEVGFDHLGYSIFSDRGIVSISLRDSRLPRFDQVVQRTIRACETFIGDGEVQWITHQCLSPWPMLSPSSREALAWEIRYACDRHNAHVPSRVARSLAVGAANF